MEHDKIGMMIQTGKSIISLEPGSTQIKAMLISGHHQLISSANYLWKAALNKASGDTFLKKS